MRDHLQIEESQIAEMCLELYREYGTTMAGLKVQFVYIYVVFSGRSYGYSLII
jgi:hypothetical protein